MSSQDLIDVNDVTLAAQRLYELAQRMRSHTFSFKENDIDHIDQIINALQELELMRVRAHEVLETETIKASALRYKLMLYPDEINMDIEEAVGAARGLNEDTINSLRDQLQGTLDDIEDLERRLAELLKENAELVPQRDAVKLEYEEVIAHLNTRLATKADKQIGLNETRDQMRECNLRIVEMEEDMVQLKEDLLRERADTREEKNRLVKEANETNEKLRIQREKNEALKQTLDTLKHEVADTQMRIDDLTKNIKKHKKNIKDLEKEEVKLRDQIEVEIGMNSDLRSKGLAIREEIVKTTKEFEEAMAELNKKIANLEKSIIKETVKTEELQEKRDEIEQELTKAQRIGDEESQKVRQLNEILKQARDELATKAAEIGRMEQEISDMEEKMISIQETHEATMQLLTKQIEELREILKRERAERMEVQHDKDAQQKEIDEFRATNAKFMREITKRINDAKGQHASLTKERADLIRQIREDGVNSKRLEGEIIAARENFTQVQEELNNKLETMRQEKIDMEGSIEAKTKELETKTPKFKDFETYFNKKTQDYDQLKKHLVALKNKKLGLEESSARTAKEIEKNKGPLSDLRDERDRKHNQAKEQLAQHAEERTEKEKSIYVAGCKMKTTSEENARLAKGIADLEEKIRNIRELWEAAIKKKSKMRQEITHQKEILADGWSDDAKLADDFESRDMSLLEKLAELLGQTGEREECVGRVTDGLQDELEGLTKFLETVASRRSKPGQERGRTERVARLGQAPGETFRTTARLDQVPEESTRPVRPSHQRATKVTFED